jgi:MFS family permease
MKRVNPSQRGASLGAVFLTVFIDLVGFSIIFPLFPAMLQWYLPQEGGSGPLSSLVELAARIAAHAHEGPQGFLAMVLFGGVLGSLYSMLQFVAAPVWGRLSDRHGRRPILLLTIAGTGLSYLLWAFSGSLLMLVVSRLLGGAMAGNLSVATAAIADVTGRSERSRGMALIGVAFGLGFIVGPAIGGFASLLDLSRSFPGLADYGVNPFSFPALVAALLAGANLLWVALRVHETLPPERRSAPPASGLNPLARIRMGGDGPVRRVLLVYFVFLLVFSGMEFTLTFWRWNASTTGRATTPCSLCSSGWC